MKKIAIDLDTTLNNLEEVWLNRYNEDYDDNLKEFGHWNVEKNIKKECGIKIYDYLLEPNFFYNLNIKPNAKNVVEKLNNKHELYIVTAYHPATCVDKVKWVNKHLPFFNSKNVIFCNNKSLINADYLIDDGPHNILGFKQKSIIIDMPYNRHVKLNDRRVRVNNWLDIKKYFKI